MSSKLPISNGNQQEFLNLKEVVGYLEVGVR